MSFHAPQGKRIKAPHIPDDANFYAIGTNRGMFVIESPIPRRVLVCQSSEGLGWEHVSVSSWQGSIERRGKPRTPTWVEMCRAKAVFWDPHDCVVQFHPPEVEYVNQVDFVLHLWRPCGDHQIKTPPSELVGKK